VTARFVPGDRVRIADRWPAGHHRTPGYVKGRNGIVLSSHGQHGRPESYAHYGDGRPMATLYRVRLALGDLWAERRGSSDVVELEVYDHWLEAL
jgi:nitrile hydratase